MQKHIARSDSGRFKCKTDDKPMLICILLYYAARNWSYYNFLKTH